MIDKGCDRFNSSYTRPPSPERLSRIALLMHIPVLGIMRLHWLQYGQGIFFFFEYGRENSPHDAGPLIVVMTHLSGGIVAD